MKNCSFVLITSLSDCLEKSAVRWYGLLWKDPLPRESGPVDPVLINHEDSQHATHMDSLVFDGIPSKDDMNEGTFKTSE